MSFIVDTTHSAHAELRPIAVAYAQLTDSFWAPRRERNRTKTLPGQLAHCESTHRLRNFQRAAGKVDAPFEGIFFNDSDIYKWLEAASWSLAGHPDTAFEAQVDRVIAEVAAAQQPDGYLNTYFMFDKAAERFTNLRDMHEIYCAGHLFQAAVAHYRATGKRTLLDVACRLADCIERVNPGACGHPEAELALVELARVTGEVRYRALAKHMIAVRGQKPALCGGGAYWQDHVPYTELNEVTGHAVRMLYLASGAADVVLEDGDPALRVALETQWSNFTRRRMHVTGGAGARWEGEAFGKDYELPSERAYTETCAAIASVMWNWRLFLLTGEVKYVDLLEWTLYNAVLPGLSLDGEHYFYQNPLADRGAHRRQAWFGCACCPPNVARTLAQLPGYFAAQKGDDVYLTLYASGTFQVAGTRLEVSADYPWDGDVTVQATGAARRLVLRVPEWAEGATLNGKPVVPGWQAVPLVGGSVLVRLNLPLSVRRLRANPRVLACRGQVAVARGPLLYCAEAADHPEVDCWELALPRTAALIPQWEPEQLGGVVTLRGEAQVVADGTEPLYTSALPSVGHALPLILIPYYTWANRSPGSMSVWLKEN